MAPHILLRAPVLTGSWRIPAHGKPSPTGQVVAGLWPREGAEHKACQVRCETALLGVGSENPTVDPYQSLFLVCHLGRLVFIFPLEH